MTDCTLNNRRFTGLNRLYDHQACEFLSKQHVCVVGIGGVGSWVAEALARSGVGHITLIDLDHIALSNVNRQIHALENTLGASKVETMAQRIRLINPDVQLHVVDDFLDADNVAEIGADLKTRGCTYIIDCIDQVRAKVALILEAQKYDIPLLVCGGSGGKRRIDQMQVTDLALVQQDALLGRVRQILRKEHGFARGSTHKKPKKMNVACVWICEKSLNPWAQNPQGGTDASEGAASGLQGLSCAGYGSCVTVTASMGLRAVNTVLNTWFS